jgi:hypothetical protein
VSRLGFRHAVMRVDPRCSGCASHASPSERRDDFAQCGGTGPSDVVGDGASWCLGYWEPRRPGEEAEE